MNILGSHMPTTICTRVRAEDTHSPPKIFPPYAKLFTHDRKFWCHQDHAKIRQMSAICKMLNKLLIQFLLHFPFTGRHHQGFDPPYFPYLLHQMCVYDFLFFFSFILIHCASFNASYTLRLVFPLLSVCLLLVFVRSPKLSIVEPCQYFEGGSTWKYWTLEAFSKAQCMISRNKNKQTKKEKKNQLFLYDERRLVFAILHVAYISSIF